MMRQAIFGAGKKLAYAALDARWAIARSVQTRCPVCDGGRPFDKIQEYGRTFLRCRHCSHIWVHDYSRLRANFGMGLTGWGGDHGSEPDTGGESEMFLARFCAKTFGSKSILLFGTGPTRAFPVLRDEGLDVYGCDVGRDVIAYRQRDFGADRFFHVNEASRRKYDVVIATEVIEHFFDPMAEFASIAGLCGPDGVFCGSTGFSSHGEVDDGERYMAPRGHVIYWSERSLGTAFKRFGWNLHTFGLDSNAPSTRLFFGTANPAINAKLDALAPGYADRALYRWESLDGAGSDRAAASASGQAADTATAKAAG